MSETPKVEGTGKVLLKGNSTLKIDMSVSISELMKRIKDLESKLEITTKEASAWRYVVAHNHGKGTKDCLTKYLDINGNIGDSVVHENEDKIGINTDDPQDVLQIHGQLESFIRISTDGYGLDDGFVLGTDEEYNSVMRGGYSGHIYIQNESTPGIFDNVINFDAPDASIRVGLHDGDTEIDGKIYTDDIDVTNDIKIINPVEDDASTNVAVINSDNVVQYRDIDDLLLDSTLVVPDYHHIQNSSSDTWNITHNLGKEPVIATLDSSGNEIEGEIINHTVNNLTIKFGIATTGSAWLKG